MSKPRGDVEISS